MGDRANVGGWGMTLGARARHQEYLVHPSQALLIA